MAFRNPIIGGNDTLVRNAMQSEGFVSGSNGWRIERNGNSEFNDVAVRGTVTVGDDAGPQVIIDTDNDDEGQIILPTNVANEEEPAIIRSYDFSVWSTLEIDAAKRVGETGRPYFTLFSATDDAGNTGSIVMGVGSFDLGGVEVTLSGNEMSVNGQLTAGNMAAGVVNVSAVADVITSVTITGLGLTPGLTYIPQATGNSNSTNFRWVTAAAPTSDGLTVRVLRATTADTLVYWSLMGVTS